MSTLNSFSIRTKQWVFRIAGYFLVDSIPLLRKSLGVIRKQIQFPKGIQWEQVIADGIQSEWIIPPNARQDSVLLFLHGGGGVLGLENFDRLLAGYITLTCGIRALLPHYRLAPEYPFPAGLDDCVAAYRWLLSQGYLSQRIVVAGDSMGGMLTITLLLALRLADQPLPAAAVCISSNTDPLVQGKTMQSNAFKDASLTPKFARTLMRLYVSGHDLNDPLLAPLHADLSGLPPILIQAGADEILLDDSVRFSDRAKAAGINVILEVWPHMWHVWHTAVPALPEANQAIDHIAKFVQSHLE
jgi:epsilon-lactone hydrolase